MALQRAHTKQLIFITNLLNFETLNYQIKEMVGLLDLQKLHFSKNKI